MALLGKWVISKHGFVSAETGVASHNMAVRDEGVLP